MVTHFDVVGSYPNGLSQSLNLLQMCRAERRQLIAFRFCRHGLKRFLWWCVKAQFADLPCL